MVEFPSIAIITIATDCFSDLLNDFSGFEHNVHRMKNVQIRSFFLLRTFPHLDQKKLELFSRSDILNFNK